MVKYEVLYDRFNNENSNTAPYPVAEWCNQVDLNEEITRCFYWDDDRLVNVLRYSVYTVFLPDWLKLSEWISNLIQWNYLWSFGSDPEWPEKWQRVLLDFESALKLASIRLLKTKKFKSNLRKSLCEQLINWMETPQNKRKYDSPFSRKQWDLLLNVYLIREAKNISSSIYYNDRYSPIKGIVV